MSTELENKDLTSNDAKPVLAAVIPEHEKINALREVRKLISILNTYGNCLVPSLNGKDTTAQQRLNFFVEKLLATGLTIDDIELQMAAL